MVWSPRPNSLVSSALKWDLPASAFSGLLRSGEQPPASKQRCALGTFFHLLPTLRCSEWSMAGQERSHSGCRGPDLAESLLFPALISDPPPPHDCQWADFSLQAAPHSWQRMAWQTGIEMLAKADFLILKKSQFPPGAAKFSKMPFQLQCFQLAWSNHGSALPGGGLRKLPPCPNFLCTLMTWTWPGSPGIPRLAS